MKFASIAIGLAAAPVGIYGLHRLLLWMERKRWIFYWRKRSSVGAGGNILMRVSAFYDPSIQHTIEVLHHEEIEEQIAGDPLEPGGDEDIEREMKEHR